MPAAERRRRQNFAKTSQLKNLRWISKLRLRPQGNEAYKNGDFKAAIELYTKLLENLADSSQETSTSPEASTSQDSLTQFSVANEDIAVIFANRAAAFLNVKQYEKVIDDCKEAIRLNDGYIKAYLRYATALEYLGDYSKSLEIATKGLDLVKETKDSPLPFTKLINKVKQQVKIKSSEENSSAISKPQRPLSEQDIKTIEEMQKNLQANMVHAQKARKESVRKKHDIKRVSLTLQQLDGYDKFQEQNSIAAKPRYFAAGRVFIQQTPGWIKTKLEHEREEAEKSAENFERMEQFYDEKIRGIETNIREIVQGS